MMRSATPHSFQHQTSQQLSTYEPLLQKPCFAFCASPETRRLAVFLLFLHNQSLLFPTKCRIFLNIQLRNQVKNSRCQPFYRFAVTVKCCTFLPVVLITSATNNLPTKATIKIHTFIISDTLNMHSYHWPGVTWIHG